MILKINVCFLLTHLILIFYFRMRQMILPRSPSREKTTAVGKVVNDNRSDSDAIK